MTEYTIQYCIEQKPMTDQMRYTCTLIFSSGHPIHISQLYEVGMEESCMDETFAEIVLDEFLPILKEKLPTQFQAIVGTIEGRIIREGDPSLQALLESPRFNYANEWLKPGA